MSHPPPFLVPLMLINLTAHMALSGGRVAGSVYALKHGASEAVAGILMALYALLPVLTAMRVGRWVDRAGARVALRVGVVCVVLGALVPAFVLSVPALFVSAVLVGFGFNVVSVALQNTVGRQTADMPQSERLVCFGWFAMAHSVSSTVGPLLAGVVIDLVSYRASFAVLAMCALVAAALIFRKQAVFPPAEVAPKVQNASKTEDLGILGLLRSREMRRIYGVSLALSVAWDLFIVMLPVLGTRLGFSASVIGLVFALFALGTFAVRFATTLLARRFQEWQILRAALGVIALSLIALPFARQPWVLMMLGFTLGAALGSGQPNMLSLLHASAPSGRSGEAVGLRSLLGNSSSVSVPVAFGVAVGTLGVMPLLFAGALMAMSALPAAHNGVKKT